MFTVSTSRSSVSSAVLSGVVAVTGVAGSGAVAEGIGPEA